MKNRLAAALAAALLGLTFTASASFAADPTDAATDVVVDPAEPLVTDEAVDAVAYGETDPTTTDEPVAIDDPAAVDAGSEVSPEAMRALTMDAPMAANAPVEEESTSAVLPAALAAATAAVVGFAVVRRRKLNS